MPRGALTRIVSHWPFCQVFSFGIRRLYMYLLSTDRMMLPVSALDTDSVWTAFRPDSSSAPPTVPVISWISGDRPEMLPGHPNVIWTGTTWPFWTMLTMPSLSGERKRPWNVLTSNVVVVVSTPPLAVPPLSWTVTVIVAEPRVAAPVVSVSFAMLGPRSGYVTATFTTAVLLDEYRVRTRRGLLRLARGWYGHRAPYRSP